MRAAERKTIGSMETLVWIVTGGLIGWMSYALLRFNAERGAIVSIVIGAIGALVGAKAIAPMFIAAASATGEVSLPLVLFASGAAVALLALGDMLHQRWGM
jgi:uncharacterized membrane protein YeaQ/YmgE (transglycosylase-associated protein family)